MSEKIDYADNLYLENGRLKTKDGQSLTKYLRNWENHIGANACESVNIVSREYLINLTELASNRRITFCSFCRESNQEKPDTRFVQGAKGAICSDCVSTCIEVIADADSTTDTEESI